MNKHLKPNIVLIAILLLSLASAISYSQERTTSIEEIPTAAKAIVLKHVGSYTITEVESFTVAGITVYSAEWIVGSSKHEILVDSDGTLLRSSVEEAEDEDEEKDAEGEDDDVEQIEFSEMYLFPVEPENLPDSVKKTLQTNGLDIANVEIESFWGDENLYFLIEAEETENHETKLLINADGDLKQTITISEIEMSTLPNAIREKVAKKSEVEKLLIGGETFYEIEYELSGIEKVDRYDSNGNLLLRFIETNNDSDDDEK